MGKLEKLIVLAVLFAAVVVLAVSLNRGKGEVQAADPLSGARDLLDADAALESSVLDASALDASTSFPASGPEAGNAGLVPGEKPPSLLLSAGTDAEPPLSPAKEPVSGLPSALRVEPESDPSRPILLDRQGLRPSFMDEYMMYTVAEGDTWSGLAQRFYQDGRFTRNLHLANEDLDVLVPGKDILVPVFDLLAVDAEDEVAEELEPAGTERAGAPLVAGPADSTPTRPIPTPAEARPSTPSSLVYEVRAGDTLSDISLAALGTATRWKELLELNLDVLKKPEDLRVGMKLRLPTGARLPTVAKAEPKKPQAKPKTSQTETTEPATPTKKKKVN